ncbi:MAG: hypothetical protein D6714_00545 [Bacteroidetes bacterium]|nr:MAG: hypothetical protein D6714_00545 [Bacteroidota bacterium]
MGGIKYPLAASFADKIAGRTPNICLYTNSQNTHSIKPKFVLRFPAPSPAFWAKKNPLLVVRTAGF